MKSRTFWVFASLTGSVSGAVAFDRYQAHALLAKYMEEAKAYGDQPIYDNQHPRRLGLVLISPDEDALRSARDHFRNYSVKLLTIAGVDYQWILAKDPIDLTKKWNARMQEAGTPEKMLDENKYFSTSDLNTNLLKPLLQKNLSHVNENITNQDWKALQNSETSWSSDIDGFVALNQSTFDSLHENFNEIIEMAADSNITTIPSSTVKQSWFSFLSSWKPSLSLRKELPLQLLLTQIPCEYSQNPFQRLYRYLFAQRTLTREIGSATLKIIRDSTRTPPNPPNYIQFYK